MKFAKQLQEQSHQEWLGQYLDYKLMKKALKLDEHDAAVHAFLTALEAQLRKVAAFMRSQHGLISNDFRPLELVTDAAVRGDALAAPAAGSSASSWAALMPQRAGLDHHCSNLVETISAFRKYVELNHTAFRKIVKKFDKRFQVRFLQEFQQAPLPADMWMTVGDIETWMLVPAERCMRLMRDVSGGSFASSPERPLRQLVFWVDELRAGRRIADLRASGRCRALLQEGLLTIRAAGEEPEPELQVKNTFIHMCDGLDDDDEPLRPRRRALSYTQDEIPAVRCEEAPRCEEEPVAAAPPEPSPPPPPFPGAADAHGNGLPASACSSTASAESSREGTRQAARRGCAGGGAGDGAAGGGGADGRWAAEEAAGPTASSRDPGQRTAVLAPPGASGGYGGNRWWADVSECCPLTGFPLSLLPYPPFKLRMKCKQGDSTVRLVDGLFLALQIISTFKFEAMSHSLTAGDIDALDAYLKKCKLGPSSFRISRAMQLQAEGSEEMLRELAQLRTRARRRLEDVKRIQRLRLAREAAGADHMPAGPSTGPCGDELLSAANPLRAGAQLAAQSAPSCVTGVGTWRAADRCARRCDAVGKSSRGGGMPRCSGGASGGGDRVSASLRNLPGPVAAGVYVGEPWPNRVATPGTLSAIA